MSPEAPEIRREFLAALEGYAWVQLQQQWQAEPSDGAHDLGHIRRVLANVRQIAVAEVGADMAVLIPAAIWHDAVNLPKSDPDRAAASRRSAAWAQARLTIWPGYPPDLIPLVMHAIAAHSFSAGIAPASHEARILQDADRLEALGAIGLARMFHVAGQMGAALFDDRDPLAKARALDDRRFSLDHIEVKLLPIARGMQTATGRRLAHSRVAHMLAFRDQLLAEITPCG